MPVIDDAYIANHGHYEFRCHSCGEDVGCDDCMTIMRQIRDGEKNCMWCGDDFELDADGTVSLDGYNTTVSGYRLSFDSLVEKSEAIRQENIAAKKNQGD